MLDRARRRHRQLRLLDLYGSLLTDHQRRILHFAWELDWSYGEIAQREGVSRTAVYDVVKRTTSNLDDYKRKLGLDRAQRLWVPDRAPRPGAQEADRAWQAQHSSCAHRHTRA